MLNLEISKKIIDFTSGLIDAREFEIWLYENSSLENQFGADLYLELISIDYSNKESKYKIQKLTDKQVDFASIHRQEILKNLELIVQQKGNALELFLKLYYFACIGYYFLAQNDLIANCGEQGKSILLSFEKDQIDDYWAVIKKQDPSFFHWIKDLISKIENNKIVLTNERHIGDYGQISYKYREE